MKETIMNDEERAKDHEVRKLYAIGVMWFLILLGIGGCGYMVQRDGDKPFIHIETK